MADTKVKVFYEGADDRAFLQNLQSMSLLPTCFSLTDLPKRGGAATLAERVLGHVPTRDETGSVTGISGRLVVLRDLDDYVPTKLGAWFAGELRRVFKEHNREAAVSEVVVEAPGYVCGVEIRAGDQLGRAAVVGAGLPDERDDNHGIAQFAIDDYVLRLMRDGGVYAEAQRSESKFDFGRVPQGVALRKLRETVALLRRPTAPETPDERIDIPHSKRLALLFRGITGFPAANATFHDAFLKALAQHRPDGAAQHLTPLVDDFRAAERWLLA